MKLTHKIIVKHIRSTLSIVAIVFFIACEKLPSQDASLKLWYTQPAMDWQSEALPLGNAYMGAMFFGGLDKEQIQFTEGTLWSGGPGTGDDYNFGIKIGAWKYLSEIRSLLDEGMTNEAHDLAQKELTGNTRKVKSKNDLFGNYGAQQSMGSLFIEIKHEGLVENYKRVLDLENAEGLVNYNVGNIEYSRRYFASYPAKALVYHFESSIATDYKIYLETPHKTNAESFKEKVYSYQGEVEDNGMEFETSIKIETDGSVKYKEGNILVRKASYLNIYHVAATDYINEYPNYTGNDYLFENRKTLKGIADQTYDSLRKNHKEDYHKLFDRVKLDLGNNKRDTITTDIRLLDYAREIEDFGLEVLYFQYSRYLMIAGSRPGSMPLNLQGKWNNSTNPPWASDYHMNINQQMLYWPAEITNLSECHEPLFDYMETLIEPGKISAKEFFNARGWIVNTMNNPFGYTSPGWKFPWGFYPAGAGWLCQHLWEHYEFTQDKMFLEETAYPLMKEASLFWIDYLIEDKNGYLISSPSYSPEHGGISKGASMDHQIAWDLLNNTMHAGEILKKEKVFQEQLRNVRDKIRKPKIGKWGQLQEWMEDIDDPDDKHRHISHLYALHPGKQISLEKTPKLAEAAKVSLNARGDGGTGWSLAWKINFWARLKDGNRAYDLYRNLLNPMIGIQEDRMKGGGTYANLLCAHPPFQLDGNMGGCAGMAEMLLQSHTGTLELLPALPSAWKTGSIKGLKARGGFEVNLKWEKGHLNLAEIKATKDGVCKFNYQEKNQSILMKSGELVKIEF
jgi:alpha-L-fucosidase 2